MLQRIRFGLQAAYIDELNAISASVCLRVYPAYRRYLPGRLVDLENGIWRRLSLQFGAGTVLVQDETVADVTGMVISLGAGWDLDHGVSVVVGYSMYSYAPAGEEDSKVDGSLMAGISLNAELWEQAFSTFKK